MAIAVDRVHGFGLYVHPPRCKLPSFTQQDYQMLDFIESKPAPYAENGLVFKNFQRSFSSPCLYESSLRKENVTSSSIEIVVGHAAPRARALVIEVAIAMASGASPKPASSGLGGAYFLHGPNGDTIAVAKPTDEEPLAFNNPKELVGRMLGQPGIMRSIRIGESGLRESAAYLLDYDGFAGVPPTALVRFSNVRFNLNDSGPISTPVRKIASLQRYIHHDCDAGDLGPSSFSLASVHRIGILDVRLMNLDRHAGNILVRRGAEGTAELVPIDHGFCLPETLDDPYFEWLHWPQASIPFSDSELDYISHLDPRKDAALLRTKLPSIRESSIRVLMVCTIFLKRAAASGLCLADIGNMMTREFRPGHEDRSTLESLCINAKARLSATQHEEEISEPKDNANLPNSIPRSFPCNSTLFTKNGVIPSLCRPNRDDYRGNSTTMLDVPMRSASCHDPSRGLDGESISFGEMDSETWTVFLDNFEHLLPEALEKRKAVGLSRCRLGSSCVF